LGQLDNLFEEDGQLATQEVLGESSNYLVIHQI